MTRLEVRGLTIAYRAVPAVREVDLDVEGGLLVLIGASGCGKTTLLRAIAGFEEPQAGSIALDGVVLSAPGSVVPPERRGIGMVFQEGALFPHRTVWDNVRYGVHGDAAGEARARRLLETVRLGGAEDRFPDQLSGGQQQRVALARALAPAPRLLLFDEPFAGLDPALREDLRSELRQVLAETATAAVLVSHDRNEALAIADRLAVMVEGRLLQVGSPETVYARPASAAVARFMGSGLLLTCTVEGGRFRSAVGSGRCDAVAGPGLLLLRPEDVRLRLVRGGEAVVGRLEERRSFGHDALDRVRLDSGVTVDARVLTGDTLPIGSRVAVELRERLYRVFAGGAPAAAGP